MNKSHAENPYGIHYLKFLTLFMLVAMHGLVFIGNYSHYELMNLSVEMWRILALLPSVFLIPMTAGAVQALLIKDQVVDGRLRDYDMRPLLRISLFICLIDSVEAAVTVTPSDFFSWNVIHYIAVSIVVITLLARISTHLVWLSGVLVIAVTPTLRKLLEPWQIRDLGQVERLNDYQVSQLFMLVLGLTLFTWFLFWIFRTSALKRTYRWRIVLLATLALNIYIWTLIVVTPDPYFAARIVSLPVGALVGQDLTLHLWPLFPWYGTIALAFSFYLYGDFWRHRLWVNWLLLSGAALGLAGYYRYYLVSLAAEIEALGWSPLLIRGHMAILLYTFSSFLLFAVGCNLLALNRWQQKLSLRFPVLYNVPRTYSKAVLPIYVFTNTFGILFAYLSAQVLPQIAAVVLYPELLAVLSYWPGKYAIRWIAQRRIQLRFRPR